MKKSFNLSGIRIQHQNATKIHAYKEEFDRKGFTIISKLLEKDWISKLQKAYDEAMVRNKEIYIKNGINLTKREFGIIRQIYRFDEIFLETIIKNEVKDIVSTFIEDDWIITQQNGSHVDYGNTEKQSIGVQVWHRDFVFRHITTSKPLLINILIPLDRFTIESGATNVLPYSHLFPEFPSNEFVEKNYVYAEAEPGDIIILNGLTYHAAGQNTEGKNRRSFNTVFAVPAIRHQVAPFPEGAPKDFLNKYSKYLTGGYTNNPTILDFIRERNT